jgi:hypothetical protein
MISDTPFQRDRHMAKFDKQGDPIEYLINRSFPFARRFPPSLLNVGETDSKSHETMRRQHEEAERYRAELVAMTPDEIIKIVTLERQKERDEIQLA